MAWLAQAGRIATGGRPPFALCYHGVGQVEPAQDPHGLFVSRELFEHHLDVIEARGYRLVSLSELWRLIERGEGERHGAITFDDGLRRTVETAVPILRERGLASTMYLPSGLLGMRHPDLLGDERIIEREQVGELVGQGVEVGAHTVDHVKLTELGHGEAIEQMGRSKAELEDLLGRAVTSMAYPFGAIDDGVVQAARAAGYETACACSGPGPWRALTVPREPVFSSASDLRMSLKLAGLYGRPSPGGRTAAPSRPPLRLRSGRDQSRQCLDRVLPLGQRTTLRGHLRSAVAQNVEHPLREGLRVRALSIVLTRPDIEPAGGERGCHDRQAVGERLHELQRRSSAGGDRHDHAVRAAVCRRDVLDEAPHLHPRILRPPAIQAAADQRQARLRRLAPDARHDLSSRKSRAARFGS